MKILLLTDGIFPFVMGGMQKHSYYLAKYLALNDCKVEIVHCSKGPLQELKNPAFKDWKLENVTFNSFIFPTLGRLPGHYVRENKKYSKSIFDAYFDKLNEFDFIYSQGLVAWEFLQNKENIKTPIFSNLHGYEMFQKPPSFRVRLEYLLLKNIAKEVSLKSDFVFSFGGKISHILYKLGVPEDSILECSIGIEEKWIDPIPQSISDRRKFVFIGRNERRKGIIELNQALEMILKEKDFEMHFIGPIPESSRITNPRVIYHGSIGEEEKIKKILNSCDVLLCPSHSEGMPTVIMEGMASSLAIIATDVGAIKEQVNSENGWLLDQPNVSLIKDAIVDAILLSENNLLNKKEASLNKVRNNFLWSKVINKKINLLSRAIKA
jgi:glycosyltransferase involved in cell wall biosynthesis